MKTVKYLSYLVLGTFVLAFTSCEPKALKPEDVFKTTDDASLAHLSTSECIYPGRRASCVRRSGVCLRLP